MRWHFAAGQIGGTENDLYPWGTDFLAGEDYHCNIWQGAFPKANTKADGFASTAPARFYEPNGYGLYQVIGNVWEWCSNPARIPLEQFRSWDSHFFEQRFQQVDDAMYATRGGSFLCHESYCKRYRIAARNGNSGMSAANNLGFRCAKS